MAAPARSFPGPVFQRLRTCVRRPAETLDARGRALWAPVLLRLGLGLAAAAGLVQAFLGAGPAVRLSAVAALGLSAAALAAGCLSLASPGACLRLLRNPDAPLTRFAAAALLWPPLFGAELFLLFVWSPGRLVDAAAGIELLLIGILTLSLAGPAWETTTPGRGARPGLAGALAGLTAGSLLFAGAWALAGGRDFAPAALALLAAAAAASGHWVLARPPGRAQARRFEWLFYGSVAWALAAGGLGRGGASFLFLPAAAAAAAALVVERRLLASATLRSAYFRGLGAAADAS